MAMPKMPPVNYFRQLRMFEDGVPRRLRFWIVVAIAFCYQFAAGVYLASLTQMVGETGCLEEDVTMGGYCTLIGLNIIFPILFRWKFGLFTRQLFFVSSIAIIICSAAAMFVSEPVVLWIICLFAGYFKMMGMFGCMSTIQLNMTPTRNFGVFLPVVYVIVCGSIQLSGLTTAYVSYFTNWRMMNLVVLGLMLAVDAVVYFLMKHDHRSGPPIPLKGIDWIGQTLWIGVCVVAAWIFTFGSHYDWWDSIEIWRATFIFILLLAVTILYSMKKKEPFIHLKAFSYSVTWQLVVIMLGMAVLTGAAHVLQPIFLGSILHYDSLNIISLNYPELAGIVMGAIMTYFALVRWKWGVKPVLFFAVFMATYFVLSMFFLCDAQTDKILMYLAYFALGVAEVMIDTIATYYMSQNIPFVHFFMNITILGFVRCGTGTAAGAAIVHELFHSSLTKNFSVVSESFTSGPLSPDLLDYANTQAQLISLKECFGYMVTIGIVLMLLILISRYSTTIKRFVPRIIAVRRWMTSPKAQDPTL
jgi:hypothetical protein